ncbi:HupE/UreJ family protein [Pseudaminobacter sp. NGMCC 1.201702]|uniref:HupE/UreJ family protein n=1 Tax=Pseudaminobacter sp. NGMCC 1.201702 TaxID=3391825 RepID=UPI0039F0D6FE
MSRFRIRALLTAAAVLLPSLAMAHTGHGEVSGFAHGFAHPLGGLDHILAMVMVGLLAAQLGGRALWLVPASFVAVMALGGGLGLAGFGLPFVELGIALSIIVLGAAVAFGLTAPVAAAMGLVGFFAIFHGHAHGAEMPETVAGLAYGSGFIAATALLHAAGLAGGLVLGHTAEARGATLVKCLGGAASLAGVGILTGVL